MRAIRERIESGEYALGDMLPSETQLVRELSVARLLGWPSGRR
ncbi:GntR family transcriptional regulator [Nonomuraea aurantiaca]|nr:GntR family transcriptional regulator [Nonomuraea aurantiaca]